MLQTTLCLNREKLWARFVADLILERDDPTAAARRARLPRSGARLTGNASRDGRGRPPFLKDAGDGPDKAYEREYLEPDRKRVHREG